VQGVGSREYLIRDGASVQQARQVAVHGDGGAPPP
jgi:hypothetical protein